MKKSVKALLWSGLVVPGAGHFFLKRYATGMALLVPTIFSLAFLIYDVLQKATAIAEKIVSGAVSADATTIAALVSGSATGSNEIAGYVILVCWVAGMVDSYRIGSMDDRAGANDE